MNTNKFYLAKNKYTFFIVLAVGLFMLAAVSVNSQEQAVGLEQSAAGGLEQSPIDIVTMDVVEAELPVLTFNYGSAVTLDVENTGSPDPEKTIRANVPAGAATLQVGEETFNLLQFHWHAPGEHELDGVGFPMEMHLVHQRVGAAGPLEGLLVVGVWIMEGAEPNVELDKIFRELPAIAGERRSVEGFDLNKLLPEDRGSFRYPGSLTTPEFNEGVQWIVMKESIELSAVQADAFKALFSIGNAREVQPLNERIVETELEAGLPMEPPPEVTEPMPGVAEPISKVVEPDEEDVAPAEEEMMLFEEEDEDEMAFEEEMEDD